VTLFKAGTCNGLLKPSAQRKRRGMIIRAVDCGVSAAEVRAQRWSGNVRLVVGKDLEGVDVV
jgi:hypothetical protein